MPAIYFNAVHLQINSELCIFVYPIINNFDSHILRSIRTKIYDLCG